MKNLKRLVSSLLCGTLLAALLTTPAFALTFPDVEDDPTVSWAKDAINEMTDEGYIKGYDDGTFKPQRAVSKIETLILMSRILGVEDDAYAQSVDWADNEYSATVNAINTTYTDELCYLMYYDVIDLTDLRNYASSANANTSLLRWQAAYLMAKLAGDVVSAEEAVLDPSTYSDYDAIPEEARSYVAYATNMKLMNGMGADENGKDYFSPETTLTRAQMATLLNRMIGSMDRSFIEGTVVSRNSDDLVITSEGKETTCKLDGNTVVKVNGSNSRVSNIENGSMAMVTYTFGNVRLVETVPGEAKTTLYGVVAQTSDNANGQQITVKDYENQSDSATYTLASDCYYDIKGSRGSFGDIKVGNCVRLVLTGSRVTECYIIDKEITETGYYADLLADDDKTYITVIDDDNEEVTYVMSSNGVNVTRNGVTSSLRELVEDDELVMTLTYGKVTAIAATSETSNSVGTIKEIVLSDKPEITLEINGKEHTYSMTTNTKVTVNNTEATIYDLRPGNAATVVIDGSSISSIESSATASTGKTSVSGKVTSINTTLKVITVTNSSGGTETVYYDNTTTFLKSTGKSTTAKEIVAGSTINATGSDSTGYFVATIVIAD